MTAIGGPTALAFTPDGRMLVTTRSAALRVVQNGQRVTNLPSLTASSISAPVMPTAKQSSTTLTGTRVPRNRAWPCSTDGVDVDEIEPSWGPT